MEALLNIAISAARKAGTVLLRGLDYPKKSSIGIEEHIASLKEFAKEEMVNVIKDSYPDHLIMGLDQFDVDTMRNIWILNGLDGITNYLHGVPWFSITIAIQYKNKITRSVVFDPIHQELFFASLGGGAYLNNRRIRVSSSRAAREDMIIGVENNSLPVEFPKNFIIRRTGALALDLAYVAASRFGGCWIADFQYAEILAGILLIKEAGGLMGDENGLTINEKSKNLVTGSPKIFKAILQSLHNRPAAI